MITAACAASAWAGPALDDTTPTTATDPAAAAGTPGAVTDEVPVEYGIDIRLRSIHVPKSIIELFVDRAAGGASNTGIGLDLVRRRGNVELQLGFEFEHLTVGEGVWINKGDNVATGDEADYVLSPDHAGQSSLGWFTMEFTFINHAVINKYVSFRYGGGAGLGIITGGLYHYNIICASGSTNSNPAGCIPPRFNGTGQYSEGREFIDKYGLPPVFPVINGIIGVQIKPTPKSVINIEGGIRTVPFFGLSAGYFL